MKKQRHLIALGGGGFSMTPNNPRLDRYIFNLAAKKRPAVCFIPTASGDAQRYIDNFYRAMKRHHPAVRPSHLSLFKRQGKLEDAVAKADVFYVGGGNTFNMLLLWQAWGLDRLLRSAYEQGKIVAGISAGANCWFEQFLTDSTGTYSMMPGLGWLPGSFTPHYDGEGKRPAAFRRALRAGAPEGYACDNDAAIHFISEQPAAFVTGRRDARIFAVNAQGRTRQLETNFLR